MTSSDTTPAVEILSVEYKNAHILQPIHCCKITEKIPGTKYFDCDICAETYKIDVKVPKVVMACQCKNNMCFPCWKKDWETRHRPVEMEYKGGVMTCIDTHWDTADNMVAYLEKQFIKQYEKIMHRMSQEQYSKYSNLFIVKRTFYSKNCPFCNVLCVWKFIRCPTLTHTIKGPVIGIHPPCFVKSNYLFA